MQALGETEGEASSSHSKFSKDPDLEKALQLSLDESLCQVQGKAHYFESINSLTL